MLLESKLVISILALVILILSFVASFKHQNSFIFVVGLITCIALTRCDDWAPGIRSFVSTFGATGGGNEAEKKPAPAAPATPAAAPAVVEKKKPSAPPGAFWLADPPKDVAHTPAILNKDLPDSNLDPTVALDAQVAQDLFTANISKLETLNENVFKGDRPTEAALYSKTLTPSDLLKLVPDFPTMGHVLTSTLNDPQLPSMDMKLSERTPNPETKKLEKYGLVASPDFFPNCKAGGLGTTSEDRDPASTLRCNRPSIY